MYSRLTSTSCAMLCLVLALAALAGAAASPDMFPWEIHQPLPIVALKSDNPQCREDSQTLLDNLHNSTAWAIRMWDASAKGVVGVLAGNVYQMGNFDACVAQVYPMRAQYCLATVTVTLSAGAERERNERNGTVWDEIKYNGDPSKLRRDVIYWALCVPASCSHGDVEASINLHLAETERSTSVSVAVGEGACQTDRQEERLSLGAIGFCVVLALIVGVVVGTTIFDFYTTDGDEEVKRSNVIGYLLCFSIRKNFFEMTDRVDSDLNFLNGIRTLAMCVIIFGHRVWHTISRPMQNYEYIEKQYVRLLALIIYKGDVMVDVFFVMGGLLCAYILCVVLDKRKVNPLLVIVLRYVRLTPVYAVLIFFYVTTIYHVDDGPLWKLLMTPERDTCVENWWINLLYVSNYVKDDRMCMMHGWYLSSDMHFFIVALVVVSVLHKRPKIGICILTALIFASVLVPFLITYIGRKEPVLYFYPEFLDSPRTHDNFRTMYTKSHTRAGPYFIGVAAGYFIYRTRSIKKNYVWTCRAGLAISALVGIASVLPTSMFYDPGWKYDRLQAALYAGTHRTVWAVGVVGIGLSIVFNKSSVFNIVLSWSPFTALGKLTFCQYLVHFVMQIIHIASFRNPQHFDLLNIFSQTLGDISWSLIIALPLYLSVEAPMRLVVKRLLQPRSTLPETKSKDLKPTQKFGVLHEDFAVPRRSSIDLVIARESSGVFVDDRVTAA